MNQKRILARKLKKFFRAALSALHIKNTSAEIFFVSDREMLALKKKYITSRRGRKPSHALKKSVDVLSFSEPSGFPHQESKTKPLGEVYLNYELLKNDIPRLSFLAIHGLLHLLGYRHHRRRDMI